ncbi:MAG: arylesterase [Bacteriovoracales bacterium]|nr:arylesterase [Bacteriovoracales bacterium]
MIFCKTKLLSLSFSLLLQVGAGAAAPNDAPSPPKKLTQKLLWVLSQAFPKKASSPSDVPSASDAPSSSPNKLTLLIIGDSLSAGYKIDPQKSYPKLLETLLERKYPSTQTTIVNSSVSGSTSASAPGRLRQYASRFSPDAVLIALGSNDGLRGRPLKSMKKNLQQTIDLAQSMKMKIILAGMKIPTNYGQRYQKQFGDVFKELADKNDLIFIPFLLKGVAMQSEYNLPDGIHPNEKGQKIMAETVMPYLEKLYQ